MYIIPIEIDEAFFGGKDANSLVDAVAGKRITYKQVIA